MCQLEFDFALTLPTENQAFICVLDNSIINFVSMSDNIVTYTSGNGRWTCTISLAEFNRLYEVY